MARSVYLYRPGHPKASERGFVSIDDLGEEPAVRALDAPFAVGRFYENQCTVEGHDIGSRRKHREYMKQNNLTTMDDYKETWKRAEHIRKHGDPADRKARREAVGRAAYEVEKKRGRR